MRKILCLLLALAMLALPVRAAEYDAKSWILMDAATGTILQCGNEHQQLAPASVTKVMTLLLIMEAIDDHRISWSDMVTASEAAAAKGGSQVFLKVGETMTVEDMVKSIAVSSANDCACAMAEHLAGSEAAFVDLMNKRAAELGMADTHFVNCHGLPAEGHVSSAWDIALMSRELILHHPDLRRFTTIWMDSLRGGEFELANTNKLIRFYDGATGLKTGSTSSAGYCISATAEREGMELIAVVLGGSTSQKRFDDAKTLLNYGFATYALHVVEPQEPFAPVPVHLGMTDAVSLALPEDGRQLLVKKAQVAALTTEVSLPETVEAPVAKGQQIGTMTVREGEHVLREIPVLAAEPVEKLTWGEMFARLVRGAFLRA